MSNYFDYISEAADSSVDELDDFDDVNDVYNEMDATMCEFDSYVQESVGVAIAAGVGGAALLGGLIALIIKCFGSSSSSSASRAAKKAKVVAEQMEKAGQPLPENIKLPTVPQIEAAGEAVVDALNDTVETVEQAIQQAESGGDNIPAPGKGIPKPGDNFTFDHIPGKNARVPSNALPAPGKDNPKPGENFTFDYVPGKKTSPQQGQSNNSFLPAPLTLVTTYPDLKQRLDAIEKTSERISQKQKDLKKTEQKLKRSEQHGATLKPQQQSALKQKQGRAGNLVAQTSSFFTRGLKGLVSMGVKGVETLSGRGKRK
jgi:hypothetical protein